MTPGKVRISFVDTKGKQHTCEAPAGLTLMEAARDLCRLDIEAACDGTCACSTCHVYLTKDTFDAVPAPSEDELDMLDLAPSPKPTSRLSCQVKITPEIDGAIVTLPAETQSQLR
jgi:ferredoxin